MTRYDNDLQRSAELAERNARRVAAWRHRYAVYSLCASYSTPRDCAHYAVNPINLPYSLKRQAS